MENNEIEKAVTYFSIIYTEAKDWEEQIQLFIQRNKLDVRDENVFDRIGGDLF